MEDSRRKPLLHFFRIRVKSGKTCEIKHSWEIQSWGLRPAPQALREDSSPSSAIWRGCQCVCWWKDTRCPCLCDRPRLEECRRPKHFEWRPYYIHLITSYYCCCLKWIWWRKMNIDEWDGADEALLPSIAPGAMHCHRPVGGIGRHL